jgi:hypothetical protein
MRFLKDPLVAFLLAGAGLFLLNSLWVSDDGDHLIEVTDAEINRLTEQWAAQMGRPPDATELDGLIKQFISEEVYYREALRLNLDANDTIVRRRLVQKLTFLTEDVATATVPDDATLRDYYAENAETYRLPLRMSFRHRYFSSDKRPTAKADAAAAIADETVIGDPFMLQRSYAERSMRQISDLFGKPFADALAEVSPGSWSGPIQSAYGWHAVKVEARIESVIPAYEDVANRVLADWQRERRDAANEAYYASLLEKYEIIRP